MKTPDMDMTTQNVKDKEVAISSMAVSPNGRWLAIGDFNGDVIIWDLESDKRKPKGKRLNPKWSHKGPIFGMAFSPSGKTLVTAGSDEVLVRWTFPTASKDLTELEKCIRAREVKGWGEKL